MSHICPFYADVQIYIILYITLHPTVNLLHEQFSSHICPSTRPLAKCLWKNGSLIFIHFSHRQAGPRPKGSKGHKKSSAHSVPYPFFSLRSWPHGFPPLPRPKRRLWHGLVTYTVFIRWANNGLPETDPLLSWFQNVGLSSSLTFNSCKWD